MDPTTKDPKQSEQTQERAQTPQPEQSSQSEPVEQATQQATPPGSPVEQVEREFMQMETQVQKRFRDHPIFFPFIILIIIFLTWAIIAMLTPKKTTQTRLVTPTPTPVAIHKVTQPIPTDKNAQTLVYGTWTSQSSVIRALEIGTTDIKTVATLPLTVKKVSVLSNNSLIYIDQTDSNDHGQRISIYNIKDKQITTNIPADSGYGIDDYILSPNKRYLAIWEVKFSPDTQTLAGGQSRVYAVDLNTPTVSNLLYDEDTTVLTQNGTVSIPIHYPRAIMDNGRVLADQFLPNDPNGGTGWAYGMSVVDFDGTNKQDITSMPNGTYGSQPSLSPDGKFLLFAGYDGNNGDGTKIKNGYRQAILTPDTVELLDTTTFKRYPLSNLPPSNTYSDVQWDKQTANVIISILSQNTKQMGVYSYDLGKLHASQIPLPAANGTQYGYISQLNNTKTLIGIQNTEPENLGNLGDTYAYAYTQLAIVDNNGKLDYVSVEDPFIQYISILPGNYFKNVLGVTTKAQTAQPKVTYAILQGTDTNTPQNYNFFLKTTLAGIRLQGKSNANSTTASKCENLGNARCAALGLSQNSSAYAICQTIEKANNRTANACY